MVYDLLVIGGGIQGAAVARDAALRGLRVILFERSDFASGTSSRSSKLIHGGIRYLETGQLRLVREALRERALLLDLAPEYVRPLSFLIPHYASEGRSPLAIRMGLILYAALAGHHPLAEHGRLSAAETLALEPGLEKEGLRGASRYWDAQMDDALLCVATAVAADRAGAAVRSYTEVIALEPPSGTRPWRARVRQADGGAEDVVEAHSVVNAAGPWAEEVRARAGITRRAGLRRTRGSHVVVPALTKERALLLTARHDGRVFFVLPWGAYSLIGTTDVDDGTPPERIEAAPEDIGYLLEEASRAIPALTPAAHPVRAFAGLRSLAQGSAILPWANSREHRIVREGTMLTLIGGKYTTHRSLAERVVNAVIRVTGARAGRCVTAEDPLPGRAAEIEALRARHPGTIAGTEAVDEATVVHAVRNEMARHLEDVLERRTRLWLDRDAMRRAAEPVSRWMAAQLAWDESTRVAEVTRVTAALDREEGRIA